jgi:hypothetical protein
MSWFSKAIKGVGKLAGKGLGLVSHVLPPGLRQAAAVGGSLLEGNNRREHLGALVGSVIPGIGSLASKIPGVGGLIGKAGGLIGKIPGVGKLGSLGGVGGDVLEWAKNNPDLLLGGANAIMGINDLQNAGQYKKRALSRLETPERENLDPMFSDPGNVYARPLRGVGRMVK